MDPPLDPVVVNEKKIKLNGRFPLPRLIPDGNSNEASMISQKHVGSFDSVQLINFIIHWDFMGQNKAETQFEFNGSITNLGGPIPRPSCIKHIMALAAHFGPR
jgi:hypothetical protein